jgi:hypothetical protein
MRGKFHFRAAKISLRSNFTLPQAKYHCGAAASSAAGQAEKNAV